MASIYNHLAVGHPDNPKNYNICGAKRHRLDEVCKRPAGAGTRHPGEGRCKKHGGATPGGLAAPNYKHGRYSQVLRGELRNVYEQIDTTDRAGDPLDLLPELSVQRTMLAIAIDRLQGGDGKSVLADVPGLSPRLAVDNNNKQGVVKVVGGGVASNVSGKVSSVSSPRTSPIPQTQDEALGVVLDYSKAVVETVGRIVGMMNQTAITKAEVIYILSTLREIINEFIPDPEKQAAMVNRIMERMPGLMRDKGIDAM